MISINSQQELTQLISAHQWLVLIFSANWCPDCVYLDTFIDQVVTDNSDVIFAKVDTVAFPEIAEEYQILGIPSLVGFYNGNAVHRLVNRQRKSQEQVQTFIEELKQKK